MKNILTVRKLKLRYYLLLLVVLALAIWVNIEMLRMDHVTCQTGVGICTDILLFQTVRFIAFALIILFAILFLYWFVFNKNIKEEEIVEEEIVEAITETHIITTPIVVIEEEATEKIVVRFKKDIVHYVSTHTKLSKYKSAQIVNIILEETTKEIIEGNTVDIEDFGKFKKYWVNEHAGVNPATGEAIVIEAHNRINFTPYTSFKSIFLEQEPNFLKKEYIDAEEPIKPKEVTEEEITEEIEEVIVENPVIETPVVVVEEEATEKIVVRFKKDIVQYVSTHTNLSKYKSAQVVNIILEETTKEIIEGNIVDIEDFGKFKKYWVNEHAGVNPATGEAIVIEAHNRINFTAYTSFKNIFLEQEPNFLKKEYIDAEEPIKVTGITFKEE